MRATRAHPDTARRVALYAAAMADNTLDPLETPRCPVHPTERLLIAGTDPEGRDAHWRCPVPDCGYLQLV